jgi:GWxTD domain-containing protein
MNRFCDSFSTSSGRALSFVILICIALGCARSANPDIERGSTYKYKPGFPEVRFSAVGFLDEANNPQINIAADIVYGSLIFKEVKKQQQAKMAIDIRVVSLENNDNVIESKREEVDIQQEDQNIISSQQSYIYEERIEVPAGSYKVYFTITDLNSDKKITRVSETSIPDPDNPQKDLTSIRMLTKNMDARNPEWLPSTTYDVPGRVDSLMFIFQATNNSSQEPLPIEANLIRFESDSSVARPMHYNNYSPSSIEYKGIEFDEETMVQQSERKLLQEGSVFIEFRFATQERGNYRFEVRSDQEDTELFKAREFSVKSTNYPALKTARELAGPLVYLMDDDDYEELMEISDQDSMKEAIDRFWLKEIGNKNEAVNVLKMYYERAEEANKQFSNFKEGWKTDTGMMYILFGPPWYVDRRLDQMQWSYSYNRSDPERNFLFFQPKLQSEFYPFDHFLLRRNQSYFNVQYQQRQLWLSGLILQRQI